MPHFIPLMLLHVIKCYTTKLNYNFQPLLLFRGTFLIFYVNSHGKKLNGTMKQGMIALRWGKHADTNIRPSSNNVVLWLENGNWRMQTIFFESRVRRQKFKSFQKWTMFISGNCAGCMEIDYIREHVYIFENCEWSTNRSSPI